MKQEYNEVLIFLLLGIVTAIGFSWVVENNLKDIFGYILAITLTGAGLSGMFLMTIEILEKKFNYNSSRKLT
jgi:hypothetical protein